MAEKMLTGSALDRETEIARDTGRTYAEQHRSELSGPGSLPPAHNAALRAAVDAAFNRSAPLALDREDWHEIAERHCLARLNELSRA